MKMLIAFLILNTAYASDLTRGEFISLNKNMTLQIRNENKEIHQVKIDCIKPVNSKRFKKVQEFVLSKVKGKLLVYNGSSKNNLLIGGVEDLTLSGLEWGIFELETNCKDSKYETAQSLGKTRKTGIWQK